MERDIVAELEQEEIREYKEELSQYLWEIPDDLFYPYFSIRPMTSQAFDRICRDLMNRGYCRLLARFAERWGQWERETEDWQA